MSRLASTRFWVRTMFCRSLGLALGFVLAASALSAPRPEAMADGYITGRVASGDGPEAGVWVIAETDELKTPFIKIVVT
ncbi:MAG: hypothetical protein ACWGPN_16750, partial [Gammaproteobacteria bacterium]